MLAKPELVRLVQQIWDQAGAIDALRNLAFTLPCW